MLNCDVIQKWDFWEFYLTYIELMAPLDSWAHSTSETCNFIQNLKISKFDLFRPDLELDFDFFDKIELNGILAVIFEFYVEIGP